MRIQNFEVMVSHHRVNSGHVSEICGQNFSDFILQLGHVVQLLIPNIMRHDVSRPENNIRLHICLHLLYKLIKCHRRNVAALVAKRPELACWHSFFRRGREPLVGMAAQDHATPGIGLLNVVVIQVDISNLYYFDELVVGDLAVSFVQ